MIFFQNYYFMEYFEVNLGTVADLVEARAITCATASKIFVYCKVLFVPVRTDKEQQGSHLYHTKQRGLSDGFSSKTSDSTEEKPSLK